VPLERSLTLGIFRHKVPNMSPKITKNQVFITLALTPLNNKTGWYTVLKGSHRLPRNTPENEWERIDESLDPGDAIIWRGDVALFETAGGGGKFITVGLTV
jgi:ectoine hydroxylase-related dioxygenase (phytanoyl-CoA dioxygenase family)